jgi:phosphinothricin acetyltransferase
MSADFSIRRATSADVAAITDIYNEAILTTTATFDIEPKTIEDRAEWLAGRGERYPVFVADEDGDVLGWTSLARWSERAGYDDTAETALYVHAAHRGRGIGRQLKAAMIEEARRLGFHTLVVRVTADSEASIHLNEQAGFERVGTIRQAGRKFGRLLDVHIMQKLLD